MFGQVRSFGQPLSNSALLNGVDPLKADGAGQSTAGAFPPYFPAYLLLSAECGALLPQSECFGGAAMVTSGRLEAERIQ